ncbi:MAG: hypothetical protein ACE5KV_08425, partial [Thermoplasmata archaeon]
NDNSERSVTFEGKGHEWFVAELDLYFMDLLVRYKVTISMEDFAGNKLDPPYEEEIDGIFGGVLRMLEALWEFLVDLATKIADAVGRAVSFIVDIIVGTTTKIFDLAIRPILDAIGNWVSNVIDKFVKLMKVGYPDNYEDEALIDLTSTIFGGDMFYALVGVVTALSTITLIAMPFLSIFVLLIEILASLLVDLIIGLLGGSMGVSSLIPSLMGAGGLMSGYSVIRPLWNTPDIILDTLNLLFWLFSLWATKTSFLVQLGLGMPFVTNAVGLVLCVFGVALAIWAYELAGDDAFVAAILGLGLSVGGLILVLDGRSKVPIPLWNKISFGIAIGSVVVSAIQAVFTYP